MIMHPLDAITKGFVVGVNYIGDQFGKGEDLLPELGTAGEAIVPRLRVYRRSPCGRNRARIAIC